MTAAASFIERRCWPSQGRDRVECKQCYGAAGHQARYSLEKVQHMISGTFWNAGSVKEHLARLHILKQAHVIWGTFWKTNIMQIVF